MRMTRSERLEAKARTMSIEKLWKLLDIIDYHRNAISYGFIRIVIRKEIQKRQA